MGKANLYTVKDYQTGEVLAKGTAGELEASGIVPKGYHTSEWAKHENQKRRNRKYAVTFEERQPEVKRGEKGRMMSVYTCYNAAGDVIGEGTARELWEAGVFSNDNAAYYTYKEQGGRCIKRGIAKMTCRKEMRKVGQNNARGEKADCAAKKPERPVLRKIKDPTPLDYDVHDLILYNAIARKEGRPELTYGYWAAAESRQDHESSLQGLPEAASSLPRPVRDIPAVERGKGQRDGLHQAKTRRCRDIPKGF